ncbi:MAG TPA: hypothetical protein VFU35_09365, partial [Jatrophihabitans sp.]|nr:hypothetical protein [Jatrophihabitans sp.]
MTGAGGVPSSGVGAVALNVTATGATAGGPITVYPDDGEARPIASNLNLVAGTTLADAVVVSVPTNGKIVLYNGSSRPVHLIADVSGYFLPGQSRVPGTLNATSPARVLDTRTDDLYPEPGPAGVVALKAAGQRSLPPTGITAVLLTVTVTAPQRSGYITVYAGGSSRPNTSNVNFRAGQTVANLVVAPISPSGVIDLYNASAGKTQIVADIEGYYSSLSNNWTATTPALPSGQDSQGITGVSCPTPTWCVAVGMWATQTSFTVAPLIETLSNGTWSRLEQNKPGTNIERKLTAVSCTSPTSCTAVGYDSHDDQTGDQPFVLPVVDTLSNGVWTATELPAPPAAPGDLQTAELDGVSCTSATACVAVGSYFTGTAGGQMLIETLSGTTWTAAELTAPSPHMSDLRAVSCTSDTACVAVGGIQPTAGSSVAAIETLSGGQWTLDTTLDAAD